MVFLGIAADDVGMMTQRSQRRLAFLIAAIATPAVLYILIHGTVSYSSGMGEGHAVITTLLYLAIIALGLALPYYVLKSMFWSERQRPGGKPLELADLPKDKEDVNQRKRK
jgi:cytochrome c biogenesis protein CcdA